MFPDTEQEHARQRTQDFFQSDLTVAPVEQSMRFIGDVELENSSKEQNNQEQKQNLMSIAQFFGIQMRSQE